MKKWFFLSLLILVLVSIYLFIPSKIVISTLTNSNATISGAFRYISQEEKWTMWWRDDANGKIHTSGQPFSYNGTTFRLTNQANNVAGIEIDESGLKLQSILNLVSIGVDSTGIVWRCEMPETNNPLTRVLNYRNATIIRNNMKEVMENFSDFISDSKNVYGVSLHIGKTPYTTMVSSRFKSSTYPSTLELYGYFDILDKDIAKQGGEPAGDPMMNVRKMEDGSFETQAAIPTNRMLKDDGNIVAMRMVPGNFVTTEVKGGPYTLNEALKQSELFIIEYNKTKMATSFQLLVTNRITEPDTSKWITRIYIPVVK